MSALPTIIAELEEALKAATPGPWIPGHHTNPDHPCECRSILCEWYMGAICTVHHSETRAIEEGDNPPPEEAIANARLIALMRTHLPTLLEALKRQGEALEKIAHGEGIYGMQAGEYKAIARAALKEATDV